ncbi:MAG TPA: efflux RND transporter periplasmic adaptor subunit [Burkholderiales bacterium]
MNKRLILITSFLILLLLAAIGGYWLSREAATPAQPSPAAEKKPAQEKKILYWRDPMYPQQRFDKPGKSPYMDMQLAPVYADEAGAESGITISPRLEQNLGVRTTPVEMGMFSKQLHTVGTVRPDEHRIQVVQSRAAGWVERLYVKALNDPVRRGQLLAEVYAPDLSAAQEEYLLALKNGDETLARAARARLSFLGFSDDQILALEKSGKASRRVAFYSPINGIVAELGVRQGMAVTPGMMMFNLVDLSSIWVNAEIVENQAEWITPGNRAEVRVAAYPGQVFEGRVDYIYPELTAATRTLRARIELKNPGGELKPDMFADVTIYGKARENTLMVPSEAVIQTGKRSVVIVSEGEGKFRPVQVVTGAEAGGKTEILKGLTQGEIVVASGQFLIDSEANLRTALKRFDEPERDKQ